MNLEVIEQPQAKLDFLRYKIGRKIKRNMIAPNMLDGRVIGFRTLEQKVEVFELLGFGSTKDKAERMAARALVKLETK